MRTFSQGREARGIAQVVAVAFLLSALLVGMATLPAGAQIPSGYGPTVSARAAASQSVAVVPFANRTGYRPETFGQQAADAVAAELRDRLFLDTLTGADVELWIRDLGYMPPLSNVEMARLATELEVTLVVAGDVRAAEIKQGPDGRYAEIELAVRLFDRISQEDVNGALMRVSGPASLEASDDALMAKALQQAAFEAVQQMRTRPTVTAMVLWSRDHVVFLNVGSRAGVEAGMKMVAIRSGLRIGLVEVTEANPVGSYARIIQGPPLRTGDHLRAIYEPPARVGDLTPARIERKQKRWTTMLLATAALLGIADMGSTSRTLNEGDIAAAAFKASNLANAADLGYSTTQVFGNFIYSSPSVLLTWLPYSGTEKTRIVGYEIAANDSTIWVFAPDEAATSDHFFHYNMGLITVETTFTLETDADTGLPLIEFERTFDEYDPANPPTDLGLVATPYDLTYRFVPYPPTAGLAHVYRIRPIIIEQYRLTDTVWEWRFNPNTEWSSSTANYLTPVAPPLVAGVDVSGSIGTFFFYSPIGADEAVIQIAKDPYGDFPPDKRYGKLIPGVWSGMGALSLENVQVDLTELADLPGSSTILWWRIGARNRQDKVAARPWPMDRTADYGYVWSERQRLVLFAGASTRAAAIHQQRQALTRAAAGQLRTPRRPGGLRGDRVLKAQ